MQSHKDLLSSRGRDNPSVLEFNGSVLMVSILVGFHIPVKLTVLLPDPSLLGRLICCTSWQCACCSLSLSPSLSFSLFLFLSSCKINLNTLTFLPMWIQIHKKSACLSRKTHSSPLIPKTICFFPQYLKLWGSGTDSSPGLGICRFTAVFSSGFMPLGLAWHMRHGGSYNHLFSVAIALWEVCWPTFHLLHSQILFLGALVLLPYCQSLVRA